MYCGLSFFRVWKSALFSIAEDAAPQLICCYQARLYAVVPGELRGAFRRWQAA